MLPPVWLSIKSTALTEDYWSSVNFFAVLSARQQSCHLQACKVCGHLPAPQRKRGFRLRIKACGTKELLFKHKLQNLSIKLVF